MSIFAVVQARMNSKRLPGKMVRTVHGKPMIEYVLERLQRSQKINRIVVATSREESDNPIADYCRDKNVECFRGALDNVAQRFKEVIEHYGFDAFVRVCGDSPLIDPSIIDDAIGIFEKEKCPIVTNILKRTFPKGQSFHVMASDVFLNEYDKIVDIHDKEHILSYFLKRFDMFKIRNVELANEDYSNINLSVDTEEDFNRFSAILAEMKMPFVEYGWKEIVSVYQDIQKAKGVL